MNYTIENERLRLSFTDFGGELQSIYDKKDGCEHLWQGNPEFWSGRAPILFPICGRLTEGVYTLNGKTYEMKLHGFCRKSVHTMVEQTADSITFELKPNDEIAAQYPFPFVLRTTYTLKGSSVVTLVTAVNTGDAVMPCTIGAHPGFNVPFAAGESFEDYELVFGEVAPAKKIRLSETCFIAGGADEFPLLDGTTLPLVHSLFDNDAIFLQDMAKQVTLRSKKGGKSVRVNYDDFTFVGLWHAPKSAAPYVCIEPWCGLPASDGIVDDLMTKSPMFHLEPGASKTVAFTVTIDD
jgi:galactose mutarotase-like enzyme